MRYMLFVYLEFLINKHNLNFTVFDFIAFGQNQ